MAISRGLATHLAEVEGYDEDAFEIVHYGIAPGPPPADQPGNARERERVEREPHPEPLNRHPFPFQPRGELLRAGLALVEHRQPDVVAARAEVGEEEQQVVLRARDPRDLRDVEDPQAHPASSTTRSAQVSTECSRTTIPWSVRPSA